MDSGSLGVLHTVRSTTMDPAPPPMDYIAGSGGIFRDCAVHDFDTLRWVTGQEAVEVYATGSVQGDPRFAEYGDVDTATAVIRFDSGAIGLVSAARYNGRGYDCRLEVHGFDDAVVAGWVRACRYAMWTLDWHRRVPHRSPTQLLHGPVHRGVPRRIARHSSGGARRARRAPPLPTRSKSRGWPKPPPSPCIAASRCASKR